jgi:uncharacterized OB-fold protein
MTKCPYCGRTLREHEKYCDFCEQNITKHVEKEEAPKVTTDFKELFSKLKKLFQKEK